MKYSTVQQETQKLGFSTTPMFVHIFVLCNEKLKNIMIKDEYICCLYSWSKMFSPSPEASPQKLFDYGCITLYILIIGVYM